MKEKKEKKEKKKLDKIQLFGKITALILVLFMVVASCSTFVYYLIELLSE